VPQTGLQCDGSKDFKCNIKEITTISHGNDLYVECMNIDPTDPNKEEGSFAFDQNIFGEENKGN
jgi:hypothetical protein